MSIFDSSFETLVINEIRKVIRKRWRAIERTTKYGWITSYFHNHIVIPNSEELRKLARKIGEENGGLALERVKDLAEVIKDPLDIPRMAEEIFDQCYTNCMIRANLKRSRGRGRSIWRSTKQRQEVFTISDKLKKK